MSIEISHGTALWRRLCLTIAVMLVLGLSSLVCMLTTSLFDNRDSSERLSENDRQLLSEWQLVEEPLRAFPDEPVIGGGTIWKSSESQKSPANAAQ